MALPHGISSCVCLCADLCVCCNSASPWNVQALACVQCMHEWKCAHKWTEVSPSSILANRREHLPATSLTFKAPAWRSLDKNITGCGVYMWQYFFKGQTSCHEIHEYRYKERERAEKTIEKQRNTRCLCVYRFCKNAECRLKSADNPRFTSTMEIRIILAQAYYNAFV